MINRRTFWKSCDNWEVEVDISPEAESVFGQNPSSKIHREGNELLRPTDFDSAQIRTYIWPLHSPKTTPTERTSVTSDCSVLNTLIFYQKYFGPKTVSSFIAYWNFLKLLFSSHAVGTAIRLRNRFRKKLYFRVSCMIFRFILNSFLKLKFMTLK